MNKYFDLNLFIFSILGILFYFIFEPSIHPDSVGYIDYHSVRSVGYPLVINLLNKNLEIVVLVQILFSIISSLFFLRNLREIFALNNFAFLFASLTLIIISLKVSLNILSGSFAFSIYLISLAFCIRCIIKKKIIFLILSVLFIFLGILIRPQLIFFLPTIIIFSLYLFSLTREKKFFLIIPLALLTFIIPPQINKYFNNSFNKVNVPTTDAYHQLMILPLFISQIELKNYFEDEQTANLFTLSHTCSVNKGFNIKSVEEKGDNWLYVLESNSFPIKNCINTSIDELFFDSTFTEKELISKRLFLDTIKAQILFNPQKLIFSYLEKLSFGFVNKYYFGVFCLFSFFIFIYFLLLQNHQTFLYLIFLISHISNLLIICSGAPMLTRYKFYTEALLIIISFSLIIHYLNSKNKVSDRQKK